MNEAPEIMTVKEACEYLRTSRPVLMDLIKEGLTYFTLSGLEDSHKRFKKSEIDAFVVKRGKKS